MTVTHLIPFSTNGSTARHQDSRYDHDHRVTPDNLGGYVVTADNDTTYLVCPNPTLGWDIYTNGGVDRLPVAGGGHATGILTLDAAIGALIGDAEDQS